MPGFESLGKGILCSEKERKESALTHPPRVPGSWHQNVAGGWEDAGACLTESKDECRGWMTTEGEQGHRFIEGKCKVLRSERGPDWVVAGDFCP